MATGTIEVCTSHPAFAYVYALFKTTIEIDGTPERRPWGTHRFDVAPGEHEIAVSYPWLFKRRCGRAGTRVTVGEGQVVRVSYRVGPIRYVPGTIEVDEVIPSAYVVDR